MNRTTEPVEYRLRELSALDLGKLTAVLGLASGLVFSIVQCVQDSHLIVVKGFSWTLGSAVGGFVAGVLLATLFNILARHLGGIRVRLEPVEEDETVVADFTTEEGEPSDPLRPSKGTSKIKACPECGFEIRSDRSFCPECDHSFD